MSVRGAGVLAVIVLTAACVPAPRPQPPQPSPTPSPSPTPQPVVLCGLPAPQIKFDPCAGSDTRAAEVRVATLASVRANPQRFECLEAQCAELPAEATDDIWLLKVDGTRARHEEPGSPEARAWLYSEAEDEGAGIVRRLREDGLCVGSFGTDELVVCAPGSKGPCPTYSIVNHGGANIRHAPPGYNGSVCVVSE